MKDTIEIIKKLIKYYAESGNVDESTADIIDRYQEYVSAPTKWNAAKLATRIVCACLEDKTFDPNDSAIFAMIVNIVVPFDGNLRDALWATLVSGTFHVDRPFETPWPIDVIEVLKEGDAWDSDICVVLSADNDDNDVKYSWEQVNRLAPRESKKE